MEQPVPAGAGTSAGKQETTACSAGVGSAYMRIYKKEDVQILVIFVKLSVVHFPTRVALFPSGSYLSLLLPSHEAPRLGPGTSWGWLMPPPEMGNADSDGSLEGGSATSSFTDGKLDGLSGLAKFMGI